jgi:pyruvate kinase
LLANSVSSSEELLREVESALLARQLAASGDKILIVGGLPMGRSGGTNFLMLHTISAQG